MEDFRVPTRADHAREEAAKLDAELADASPELRAIAERYRERVVAKRVDARAAERHAARVYYARNVCITVGDSLGLPAEAVAALALFGQGGPHDRGGPEGASQLPLLPPDPIWRWRRNVGPAWCAALKEVAGGWYRVTVRADGDGITVTVGDGERGAILGRVTSEGIVDGPLASSAEVRACARRALTWGRTVRGEQTFFSSWTSDEVRFLKEIVIAAIDEAQHA
jgi:hypothetical protein